MRPRVLDRDLALTRDRIFPWLADPLTYPRWLAGVEEVRPLVHEGDVAVVSVRWPALCDGPQVIELVQDPPVSVVFREAERDGAIRGRWDLTELDGGRRTRLRAELAVRASLFDRRRWALGRLLEDSVDAIARLAEDENPDRARSGNTRDNPLLEVLRDAGNLKVRWRGLEYETVRRHDLGTSGRVGGSGTSREVGRAANTDSRDEETVR